MKHPSPGFSQFYKSPLRVHSAQKQGTCPDVEVSGENTGKVRDGRLPALVVAKLHDWFPTTDLVPLCAGRNRGSLIRDAGIFSAATTNPAAPEKAGAPVAARHNKTTQRIRRNESARNQP